MTNSNDFRRYSYQNDTSYLINSFDVSKSSAAPKRKQTPQTDTDKNFKLHENKTVKSAAEIEWEERKSFKSAVKIILISVFTIALIGLTVYSFALKNELTREVSSLQTQISYAQSENISLMSRLDSMVSIGTIDEYAVDNLKMNKMKSSQIQYIDVEKYKQDRMNSIQETDEVPDTDTSGNN